MARSTLPPCSLGLRDLHPAHTRLVQPSVRTAGSKPAILEVPGTRQAEPEGKPHYVLQASRNTWNRRKRPAKSRLRSRRNSRLCLSSVACLCSPNLSPVQHEADGCGFQRPGTGHRRTDAAARCLGSPYPAQNRQRKNGLSELRRVPRGDSDGRTAERCFQWATLAGLSSRIQPLDAHTQSARPAGMSAHTQQGVQAFAAGRRSRRAAPADGALTSKLRSPSAPTW